MKKIIFAIPLLAALAMVSCRQEEKVVETNSRGVPMSIARIIMGDDYEIDTVYKAPDHSVIYIDNPDYFQHILYSGEDILANGPTLLVDSLGPAVYEVQDFMRTARVNFSNPQSVEKLQRVFPQYPEYSTVALGDTTSTGQKALFSYVVSVPSKEVEHSREMQRWVEYNLNDTMRYETSLLGFGELMAKDFFAEWTDDISDFQLVSARSMLVYEATPAYVSYNDYYCSYLGGAHGMTCNRVVTFLTSTGRGLTASDLLVPESEDAVRELIYEAIANDEDFMSTHKITSLSQARTYIQRFLGGDPLPIPDPGLLTEGVLFCYQPYEIAPYSDGIFHLLIPYSKISEYIAPGILGDSRTAGN